MDRRRQVPGPGQWHVTPETVRLLQHWRHCTFSNLRPFFCHVEAAETAIWLIKVAPQGDFAEKIEAEFDTMIDTAVKSAEREFAS